MEKNLAGRNAVVTGAAMGIGRATAEVLAERGARVIALDYNESKLNELVDVWKKAGLDITPMQCDVTSAEAVSLVFKKIGEKFPKLSILANIAPNKTMATASSMLHGGMSPSATSHT